MADVSQRASRLFAATQTVLLVLFAGVCLLDATPPLVPRHGITRTVGAAVCAAGLMLMLLAFRSLGRAIQIAPAPRPDARLVTAGVYRRFRHPIYTGILLVIVGLFLRHATPLIGLTGAAAIAFLIAKARFEEALLLGRYPEYAAYKEHTWGIVPWPRRTRPS